jgi:hypothetical protein
MEEDMMRDGRKGGGGRKGGKRKQNKRWGREEDHLGKIHKATAMLCDRLVLCEEGKERKWGEEKREKRERGRERKRAKKLCGFSRVPTDTTRTLTHILTHTRLFWLPEIQYLLIVSTCIVTLHIYLIYICVSPSVATHSHALMQLTAK